MWGKRNKMTNESLVKFIKEARKRDFSDMQIRESLLKNNWPYTKIDEAFISLQPKFRLKNQVCIFLNNEVLNTLEKRAKKNLLTLAEQIEDILRRSSIKKKTTIQQEKIDDLLLTCFSRQRKRKKS